MAEVLRSLTINGTTYDFPEGPKGDPGVPGFSPIVNITKIGTTTKISITDKDGAEVATIVDGDKGDKGDPGATGPRGTSVLKVTTAPTAETSTVEGYDYKYKFNLATVIAESGASEVRVGDVIKYSYYEYLVGYVGASYAFAYTRTSIRGATGDPGDPGEPGPQGDPGEPGHTPVRGTDYWTPDDVTAMESHISEEVAEAVASKAQLKPEFANSIEECTDTSKLYVLPDGMIYAYMLTEVEAGPAYTNLLFTSTNTDRTTIYNGTGYKVGVRLSGSSGAEITSQNNLNQGISGFISATAGQVLRIKNIEGASGVANYVIAYDSSNATTGHVQNPAVLNNSYQVTLTESQFGSGFNAIRLCFNGLDSETIVTLDEEITEGGGTTTGYAWASTGKAFVPADYEDRIVALENEVGDLKEAVDSGVAIADNSTMFISPDGNDSNDGLTASTPKKTVKACVNAGAKKISAKRGVYKEIVQLWNIEELEIFPTDNDLTYAVGVEREPIVFDTSDSIAPANLAAYNSIKRVAYSNASNTQFDKVFTKQSQPPIYGGSEYGSRYNATVWLLSEDEKTVCTKLKPVLTVAECEAETNTFTYVSGYIYVNADATSVAKIIIPTNWDCGLYFNGFSKVILKEVEVRFAGSYNIDLRNCAYFDLYKCACKYTSYGSGFHPYNSNGIMRACYATKNYDGYGISGYGHTTYIDCVSEFNFDDGMSHHDGCEGTVIGGRYEGNGKGGNTPAYGAKVNIYGGLYKDNASFGIGYLYTSAHNPASGIVQDAVMVGNPVGLVVNANCPVTAMSCVYSGNTKDKENKGLLTEY